MLKTGIAPLSNGGRGASLREFSRASAPQALQDQAEDTKLINKTQLELGFFYWERK